MAIDRHIIRYTDFPFPCKRYLPGEDIHPSKHPSGDHMPKCRFNSISFGVQTWRDSDRYLYAIDLFNYGYYWETHEVLEEIWREIGTKTPTGLFIQGFIQIAAALIKKTQSFHRGARRLSEKGLSKIRLQSGVFLGIDVSVFSEDTASFLAGKKPAPIIILNTRTIN